MATDALSIPFLTALDSRAALKGSRDALGAQQLWTKLGRTVIGNLTTVSNSARDFTITLLGHHLAEIVATDMPSSSRLETFIKWEQLTGFARAYVNGDTAFRGSERVRKTLAAGTRATISAERAHQILSSQKMYGLWGLYTVPSRSSGLLESGSAQLTDAAAKELERAALPRLMNASHSGYEKILRVLKAPRSVISLDGEHAAAIEAIASIVKVTLRAGERSFYRDHLVLGGPLDQTKGLQPQLAELIEASLNLPKFRWSGPMVGDLAQQARKRGAAWSDLTRQLKQIQSCSAVLNASASIYNHMLGCDETDVAALATRYRSHFGRGIRTFDPDEFADILPALCSGDDPLVQRWSTIARMLSEGKYLEAIQSMVLQNTAAMSGRGGQPWITIERKQLRVQMRDEGSELPSETALRNAWNFPFFLDSLRTVTAAVSKVDRG